MYVDKPSCTEKEALHFICVRIEFVVRLFHKSIGWKFAYSLEYYTFSNMKKAYSICVLALLLLAHSAMAHTSEVVHIHPHGENAFLTTWLVAACIGLLLGGRYLTQRVRQN